MGRPPKFDFAQTQEIIKLYKSGETAKSLAELFSTSQETIGKLLDKNGIAKRKAPPKPKPIERHVDGSEYEFSPDGRVKLNVLDGPPWPTMDRRLRDKRYKGSL